jgi:hypothetical protein
MWPLPVWPSLGLGPVGWGSYRGGAGIATFSRRRLTAIVPTAEKFEGLLVCEWGLRGEVQDLQGKFGGQIGRIGKMERVAWQSDIGRHYWYFGQAYLTPKPKMVVPAR